MKLSLGIILFICLISMVSASRPSSEKEEPAIVESVERPITEANLEIEEYAFDDTFLSSVYHFCRLIMIILLLLVPPFGFQVVWDSSLD